MGENPVIGIRMESDPAFFACLFLYFMKISE